MRLIDADALLERAESVMDGHKTMYFDAVSVNNIMNAPTIEPSIIEAEAYVKGIDSERKRLLKAWEKPKQEWIPVSERLPERPKNYPHCEIRRTYFLVSLESGCVKTLGFEFEKMDWQPVGSPVVAWMPLPEPYERKDNEDNRR